VRSHLSRGAFTTALAVVLCLVFAGQVVAATGADVQARIYKAVKKGQPVVVHVVVALCDNKHQGIAPVPEALGNGQDPDKNLYWGAAYGVRTYLVKTAKWELLSKETAPKSVNAGILERIVLCTTVKRGARNVDVILIAEAWDGAKMPQAMTRFLSIAGGNNPESDAVVRPGRSWRFDAGGAADLVVFVGHNGLMDGSVDQPKANPSPAGPRSAVVLACKSKDYFLDRLNMAGAHPLLLTTGLMAPEAYTLDVVARSFAAGDSTADTLTKAAVRYSKYQNVSVAAARKLFYSEIAPSKPAALARPQR